MREDSEEKRRRFEGKNSATRHTLLRHRWIICAWPLLNYRRPILPIFFYQIDWWSEFWELFRIIIRIINSRFQIWSNKLVRIISWAAAPLTQMNNLIDSFQSNPDISLSIPVLKWLSVCVVKEREIWRGRYFQEWIEGRNWINSFACVPLAIAFSCTCICVFASC